MKNNRKIFDENLNCIYAAAYLYKSSIHDIDDWCSMCVLRILRYLKNYSEKKGKFCCWVYHCIRNYRNFEDNRPLNKREKTNFEWGKLR